MWAEIRHKLIQEEYRTVLSRSGSFSKQNDAVMVLSGPSRNQMGLEDQERLKLAIDIAQQVSAEKGSILPLIINAAKIQSAMFYRYAKALGYPDIWDISCDKNGSTNTKTQMEALLSSLYLDGRYSPIQRLIMVSSDYHLPRLLRTAQKVLGDKIKYEVVGASSRNFEGNIFRLVRGEIYRIERYVQKGDLDLILDRGESKLFA